MLKIKKKAIESVIEQPVDVDISLRDYIALIKKQMELTTDQVMDNLFVYYDQHAPFTPYAITINQPIEIKEPDGDGLIVGINTDKLMNLPIKPDSIIGDDQNNKYMIVGYNREYKIDQQMIELTLHRLTDCDKDADITMDILKAYSYNKDIIKGKW